MIEATYDPSADALYIYLARTQVHATDEIAPDLFVDRDGDGRIIGIEVLAATKVLAPGDWRKARMPGTSSASAAE